LQVSYSISFILDQISDSARTAGAYGITTRILMIKNRATQAFTIELEV